MTAEQNQESGQSGEVEELPSPSFSDTGDSSTSESASVIVNKSRSEMLDELKPFIQETIERQVQSTKDKRIAKIEGRLGLLAELEEQGATIPDNLKQEMRFRDLEERLTRPAQLASPRDVGTSQQRQAVTDAVAELTRYGLSSNDPQFIELLRGQYSNPDAFKAKVTGYVLEKVAPQSPPSPAGMVQAPAATRATERSASQLEADYQKEITALSQSGVRGDQRLMAITGLKAKYREAGLNKL